MESDEDKPRPGDSPLLPPKPDRPSLEKDFSNSCTHDRLTRIWDPLKLRTCSACKQPTPEIGWLWRCVVDTNGFLPESDFLPIPPAEKVLTTFIPSKKEIDAMANQLDPAVISFLNEGEYCAEELNTVPYLSPWILKAIGARDYNHEQVKKFIRQKIDVQIAIRQDLSRSTNGGRSEFPTYTPFRASTRPTSAESSGVPEGTSDTRPSTAFSAAQESSGPDSSILSRGPTLHTSTTFSTRATLDTDINDNHGEARRSYEWNELFHQWQHLHFGRPPENPDPDRRLPVGIQNMLRFDAVSSHAGPDLRAEGFEFPELSEGFYARQANQTTRSTVKRCEWMMCQKCYPKVSKRNDKIDEMMNGPFPPMHEFMNRPVSDARIVRNIGLRQPAGYSPTPAASVGESSFINFVPASESENEATRRESHDENPAFQQQQTGNVYNCTQSSDSDNLAMSQNNTAANAQEKASPLPKVNAEEADRIECGATEVENTVGPTNVKDDEGVVGDVKDDTLEVKVLDCFAQPNSTSHTTWQNNAKETDKDHANANATDQDRNVDPSTERPLESGRKQGGLRAKLRKIFGRDRKKARGSEATKDDEPLSTVESDKRNTTSTKTGLNTHTSVVGNASLDNSLNLMIASNTPLPTGGQPTPANPTGLFPVQSGVRDTSYSSLGAAVQAAGDRQT